MEPPDSTPAIPNPGEGKRGPDGHIAYLLRQAAAAQRLRMDRTLADLDVTPPQFAALTMIGAYPGLSGAELARLAALTPQTVAVIVGNLLKRGAILRRRHPVHGRVLCLDITPGGRALLGLCRERVARLEAEMVAGLAPEAEATIRAWLADLARETG